MDIRVAQSMQDVGRLSQALLVAMVPIARAFLLLGASSHHTDS
jgi:hypothetical protein